MEDNFLREMSALTGVLDMAEKFCADHEVAQPDRFAVELMLEEVFTNLVKYGTGEGAKILVRLERHEDRLTVAITDFDSDEFDPTKAPEVDVSRPLSERTPGGLGIHLLKKVAHEINYHHRDRQSTITLTRRTEPICSK